MRVHGKFDIKNMTNTTVFMPGIKILFIKLKAEPEDELRVICLLHCRLMEI